MTLSKQDLEQIKILLGRDPSQVETIIFDTMWSEHCSYKSSKPVLRKLPTKGRDVAVGIGQDSGIIRLAQIKDKSYCIAISHESHNHPSQLLPIEGAATGVGGVVRDVYCMGANVIGVLNSLHFGQDPSNPMVEEIAEKVVLGVSDYGNPLGVPVLGGETLYHPSYNDNCLVNVAAIGLVEESQIINSFTPKEAATEPYDVILIGKSTDSTGFGGASFSSATLDEEDEMSNAGAVQVHDPFMKKVVVEAIKKVLTVVHEKKIKIGFKDLGAGGIACATSEIAVGGGFGIQLDLDKVNVIHPNLAPEVIACSETQERFCMVVPQSFSKTVCDIFNHDYDLPQLYPNAGASVVGQIINEKTFLITHQGKIVCDLPVTAITTDVKAPKKAVKRPDMPFTPQAKPDIKTWCLNLVENQNNRSKRYVYRFFDNAVQGNTVIYPGEADAVMITPIEDSDIGLAVSIDSNLYGESDPWISGAAAVAESVRNVVALGATPIALTDCLNYGNPEKEAVFYDFEQGVQGIADAARGLCMTDEEAIPVISGNVSFYNESKKGNAVVPSPVIVCLGKIDDYNKAKTMQIIDPDEILLLIGKRETGLLGTQSACFEQEGKKITVDIESEKKNNTWLLNAIDQDWVTACHDISAGGLWITLVEMMLGERGYAKVGFELEFQTNQALETWLFSESGGYVISVSKGHLETVTKSLKNEEVDYHQIGKSSQNKQIQMIYGSEKISIDYDEMNQRRESKNDIPAHVVNPSGR